jgi:hypothetical protein
VRLARLAALAATLVPSSATRPEDLAFRVLAGNQLPDHVTIARFRVHHQQALAGFLVASLRLCAAAGLVRLRPAGGGHG